MVSILSCNPRLNGMWNWHLIKIWLFFQPHHTFTHQQHSKELTGGAPHRCDRHVAFKLFFFNHLWFCSDYWQLLTRLICELQGLNSGSYVWEKPVQRNSLLEHSLACSVIITTNWRFSDVFTLLLSLFTLNKATLHMLGDGWDSHCNTFLASNQTVTKHCFFSRLWQTFLTRTFLPDFINNPAITN